MALTSAQITAFKVASGDVDLNVVHLTSVGMLVAVLFLWAAWGLSDAWSGWRNGDVRESSFIWFTVRTALLLVSSIWMFAG
ncbi:TPA: TIGR03758 family integrating conjugative element protein [Escherichia coli]|uniref:TIGR03758 family integrating conjugative element protein n=2 Tax=Enterobacteriaceae TaxID=543 RepID=A0AAN3LK82_ECOLX|nr:MULTISPECIES: TIGR03758 family integrating conjugative element protein [Enterobacteriaceae]EFA5401797.1 TIGR03758 family integrating conjugative element protein [Escherichia coli O109]HAD9198174.1 TIGR03758 family integrating conjugative element protein [Salmonella enterica]EEY5902170.1 TIGR03758 family integrating conjugative element protein [Escherichia coli]EFB9936400.1 TIGR03758 family integrating conjugative element protein [Escherichia coli]EFE7107143.1 TIGR03758 family integrating co